MTVLDSAQGPRPQTPQSVRDRRNTHPNRTGAVMTTVTIRLGIVTLMGTAPGHRSGSGAARETSA